MIQFIGFIMVLGGFILLPVVVINPKKIRLPWIKGREQSRKDWLWPLVFALFCGPMLIGQVTKDDSVSLNAATPESVAVPAQPISKPRPILNAEAKNSPSFFELTPSKFREAFNDVMVANETTALTIKEPLRVQKVEGIMMAGHAFTDVLGLGTFINDDGKITRVQLLSNLVNSKDAGSDAGRFVAVACGILITLDPANTLASCGNAVMGITDKAVGQHNNTGKEGVASDKLGNVHMIAKYERNAGLGLYFFQ